MTYEEASQAATDAYHAHVAAQDQHRAGNMTDAAYLEVRAAYKAHQAQFDAIFAKSAYAADPVAFTNNY